LTDAAVEYKRSSSTTAVPDGSFDQWIISGRSRFLRPPGGASV